MKEALSTEAVTEFTDQLSIATYCHCGLCIEERPPDVTPKDWARLNVGFTKQGVQVWCTRHECNVMHIDFQGERHPAITTRRVA